ncbi:MAG TPA: 4Fe-4S dicluster domain-containing protein [Planctomycetota bacterium]|jgi:MauM/NapG family ferredoxin protein
MKRLFFLSWPSWRRIGQAAFLIAFLVLFRRTETTGADTLPGGENFFFRIDPLVAAAACLAGRTLVALFWPSLILLGLSLVFGRFFCGWVCPLGTLLDALQFIVRPLSRLTTRWSRSEQGAAVLKEVRLSRYVLLALCLIGALLAFPLVGLFDPFALLTRGLAFWADPKFYDSADAALTWVGHGGNDSVHKFFVKHVMPFRANLYDLAAVSAAILGVLFLLEFVARRFWCRYLCPLGAVYGLVARVAFIRRLPAKVCGNCGECAADCRMGALDKAAGVSPEECNVCMDCVALCPKGIPKFAPPARRPALPAPLDLSKRRLFAAIAAGTAVPALAHAQKWTLGTVIVEGLLRPPGAGDEKKFLGLCVRCGLCMKVCPTNVLQPAILQNGIEGLFAPHLAPRAIFEQSYCEYNCNLCGQVCPSGAIPRLSIDEKHKAAIGKAYFDHNRCLPWAKDTSCIRCEEVCPLPEKAITVLNTFHIKDAKGEQIEIQQPAVDRDKCVGCGICESNCPLEGAAGIRVVRVDAIDPKTEFRLGMPLMGKKQ